jgi:hypothetical protein
MASILRRRLHKGGLLVFLLLTTLFGWSQGLEDFTNLDLGASYSDGSFLGNNGITWTYVQSRNENNTAGVNAPALMLRRVSDDSKVTSSVIPNGIGDFSVKLYKGFTGGGDRQVELFINGESKGTSTAFDDFDEHVFSVSGINIDGDIIIEIKNVTSKQIIVDDITWTAFGSSGNTGPFITNIVHTPNNVTSTDAPIVSADIIDGDGIASAELHWGTTSGSLTNTVAMALDAGDTYMATIPTQADGTTVYYEIEATDANATPETSISPEQSYLVEDPLPFGIPYFNAFGNQDDYDEAVGYGFEFVDANQNGSYVHITSGSIVTPAIDFSAYNGLTVSFDLGTYGGSGAEMDVLVSNDNGASYTLLGTFVPTSSTPSGFEQIIDLTSLNGTNGRVKFEQTTGTSNSLRFKNLNIEESQGGNVGPVITNITHSPTVVSSSDAVMVSAEIDDVDGIASAELNWGTTSGSLSNTIAMILDTGNTYVLNSAIPAQVDGTTVYYEIEATDNNAEPITTISSEQSYTVVDPAAFGIPYANALRNQADLDEALGYGFMFDNASLVTSAGGYIKIEFGGSIVSPAIDFSMYDRLLVNFDMTTFGGNNGQELSVSISNDDGSTYSLLETYIVPGSYLTFEKFIDLSALNGANGRLKFEMTGGTAAVRFRELGIQEFLGYFYNNGSWTPADPSGASTDLDDLYVNEGIATLTANTSARNITVNSGATLKVESVLTIAGNINNNGDFIFVSNEAGNGELASVPGTSNILGGITVQRYMSQNRAYRMVSSPVTTTSTIHDNWQEGATSNVDNPRPGFGTHITGSTVDQQNGFDGTGTGNPSMFTVNVATQAFEPIDNTDVNTLSAGESYLLFVRGDRSIDLTNDFSANETVLETTGSLFTGTNTQTISGANASGDFVMFGNPYQSAVDINSVLANSTNINSGFYYVYDPTLANHGAYVTVSLPAGGNNTFGSVANQYLQPGQGAQVATAAAGDAVIVFNEDDKAPGNFTATNRGANRSMSDDMLITQLYTADNYNTGGPVHDSFGIMYAEGNSNEITNEDAVKPMNFYENLGIDHNGTLLSIESRDMPQAGEVYALFSDGYQSTNYVLKIMIDGLENSVFFLEDQFTGASILLESGTTAYSFSVDQNDPLSTATDRFNIRVEDNVIGVNDNSLLSDVTLYPNPMTDNVFFINAPKLNGKQLSVSLSDISGRIILEEPVEFVANMVAVSFNNNLASGVYIVTLSVGGESQSFRMIKQ